MITWPHVYFLSKHSAEGFLMFCFQSQVLFGFCVSMDILVSSFPKVNDPSQGHLLNWGSSHISCFWNVCRLAIWNLYNWQCNIAMWPKYTWRQPMSICCSIAWWYCSGFLLGSTSPFSNQSEIALQKVLMRPAFMLTFWNSLRFEFRATLCQWHRFLPMNKGLQFFYIYHTLMRWLHWARS